MWNPDNVVNLVGTIGTIIIIVVFLVFIFSEEAVKIIEALRGETSEPEDEE